MPRYTSEEFTGSIQSSDVTIATQGWQHAVISFDEGDAAAGTVVIQNTPPTMSEAKTFGDNGTYTVGTSGQITLLYSDVGTLTLVPDSVDAAMTYRVCCSNER